MPPHTHTHTRMHASARTHALTDTHTNQGSQNGRMDRLPVCLPPQSSWLIMHAEAVVLGRWSRRTHARAYTHAHTNISHPRRTRSHFADTTIIKSEARMCTCRSSGARRQPSKRRSEITPVWSLHPHPSTSQTPSSKPPPALSTPSPRTLLPPAALPRYTLRNPSRGSVTLLSRTSAFDVPFTRARAPRK